MQTYGSLTHQIETFNQLIFGCGFYYYWADDHKRAMRENSSANKNGKTLVMYAMFDVCYPHTIELYFKKCMEHNLPKDYFIPDHWHIPPLEIESIDFETQTDIQDDNLVRQFTMRLYTSSSFFEEPFFRIKAKSFYFEKVK